MHRLFETLISMGTATAMTAAASVAVVRPANAALGVWSNPKGTLAVRTAACGAKMCGSIVWANAEALADAREAGVARLVGTELLMDYLPNGRGSWTGRVFVPDMGRSFSSRLRQPSVNRLVISGCLIHGYLCRWQEWHRLS